MTTTPDVENDFAILLSTLLPMDFVVAVGATQNLWPGPERAQSGAAPNGIPLDASFVTLFSGRNDLHNDGRLRFLDVQLTIRFSPRSYRDAEIKARLAHDALDLKGPWTGNSAFEYMDIRANGAGPVHVGPGDDDCEYFTEAFTVWLEG